MNKNKALLAISGISLVSLSLTLAFVFTKGGSSLLQLNANTPVSAIVLNSTNQPTLSDGVGSLIDSKGVKWDYKKAQNSAGNHVALENNGFMRVSPTSDYGIKGITSFTPVFTTSGTDKLILLASEDGVEWQKFGSVESGQSSRWATGYHYVGLLAEAEEPNVITINSVSINYSCTSTSSFDDVDLALSSNVNYVANATSFDSSNVVCASGSYSSFKITATSDYSEGKYHQLNFKLFDGSTFDLDELIEKNLSLQLYVHSEWTTDTNNAHLVPSLALTNGSTRLADGFNSRPSYSFVTYNAINWARIEMSFADLKASAADGSLITGFRSDIKYLENGESLIFDGVKIVGAPFNEFPTYEDSDNLTKKSAMSYHGGLHTAEITDTDKKGVTFDFENNTELKTYSYFAAFNFGQNYTVGTGATQTMTLFFIDESLHLTLTDDVVTGVDRLHNGKAIRIDALSDADTGSYPKTYCHAPKLETLAVLVDERTGLYKAEIALSLFVKDGMKQMNGIGLQTMYKQSDGVAYLTDQGLDTTTYFKLVHTSIA